MKQSNTKWYVATMNDGLFIVNRPPHPAPVDYVNTNSTPPETVIPLRHNDAIMQAVAEEIVAAHNAVSIVTP